jgi:hypothetical protein
MYKKSFARVVVHSATTLLVFRKDVFIRPVFPEKLKARGSGLRQGGGLKRVMAGGLNRIMSSLPSWEGGWRHWCPEYRLNTN